MRRARPTVKERVERAMDECQPALLSGRVICPEGKSLVPTPCWYCKGEGCVLCGGTGIMGACKVCRGLTLLIEDMTRMEESDAKRAQRNR